MDEQTKELTAIGASIGAHCQPCLVYQIGRAKELGISADLIAAAIEVGHMVERGAMSAMREFASGILDTPSQAGSACCEGKTITTERGCCG